MPKFTLDPLPFASDALEPYIDQQTMEIHHGRHHQTYVDKLNEAIEGVEELQDQSLEDLLQNLANLPESIRTAVRNNGGGHYNHRLFWEILTPGGPTQPIGAIDEAIKAKYGSVEAFKEAFSAAAIARFGSGWAWLIANENGEIEIVHTPNQDNPLMEGKQPILGLDVWEHAYYLRYQNRRPDYVEAFFHVINWEVVNQKYLQVKGK